MTIETDDMRLQFLKDFGVTDCTFTDTSAGTTAPITALLRKEYVEVEVEGEVGVESNAPFAFVRTSDVPNIQQGDTLGISGTTYTVVEVMPDGEGMTDLRLRTWCLFINFIKNFFVRSIFDPWKVINGKVLFKTLIEPIHPICEAFKRANVVLVTFHNKVLKGLL
jgi:hypothetical protein